VALTQRNRDALERIFWATLGHTDADADSDDRAEQDAAEAEALASMVQDAEPIARDIRADPADVKAYLDRVTNARRKVGWEVR